MCLRVCAYKKKQKREEMSSASRDVNQTRDHLINVDSRFRKNTSEPPTDFMYSMAHPHRNIIQMRIASVEIPNGFYAFSRVKKNTMFRIDTHDYTGSIQAMTVTIPDGDYTPTCLIEHIQKEFDKIRQVYGIFFRISLNPINRRVTISHDGSGPPSSAGPAMKATPFGLTFVMIGNEEKPYLFGLGSYLGYTQHTYQVTTPEITSESLINTAGDSYMLLAIDDYHTVEHAMHGGFLQCLAKILIKQSPSGGNIVLNDGYTVLSNDIVFPRPITMSQFRVRLLDPFGVPIDLHHLNVSISLELTEVMSVDLYDRHRLAIWKEPEPRVSSRVTGSGVPIALPGRSFS